MAVRTTIVLPDPLHERLRGRARETRTSMRMLILQALEQTYPEPRTGTPVTGPLIRGRGKRGPRFPVDENPHDLVIY
jgi:hypothetical protein